MKDQLKKHKDVVTCARGSLKCSWPACPSHSVNRLNVTNALTVKFRDINCGNIEQFYNYIEFPMSNLINFIWKKNV